MLFNDVLNTFYLRLYGVKHMIKDHSESERGNPLPPHGQQTIQRTSNIIIQFLRNIDMKANFLYGLHREGGYGKRACSLLDIHTTWVCVVLYVCRMVHIKHPFLLIEKSIPCSSWFPFLEFITLKWHFSNYNFTTVFSSILLNTDVTYVVLFSMLLVGKT